MEYHFSSIARQTYLHVIGSGTHSLDNLRRFLLDTNRVRIENQLEAVLLELRFVGPSLNFAAIYSVIVENLPDSSLVKRIAYVDANAEHLIERAEFAELAANKLGLRARIFRTVADADKWLSH